MTNLNFIKTLTAGVALTLANCPQAFAIDSGDCGLNCRYVYDLVTETLNIEATGDNAEFTKTTNKFVTSGPITNIVVGEGITKIRGYVGEPIIWAEEGVGKLVLPSTLRTMEDNASYHLKFAKIEINSTNVTMESNSWRFDSSATSEIIMDANANINFTDCAITHGQWCHEGANPTSLTISCKGNPDTCLAKFGTSISRSRLFADYYKEYDADGNLIQYHDTGYYKYDSQGNLLESWNLAGDEQYDAKGNTIAKYDNNGNLRWSLGADGSEYYFDTKGKLSGMKKTSAFTPTEAAALVRKGNNNKVTLTFK